jgi:hypothetical protein
VSVGKGRPRGRRLRAVAIRAGPPISPGKGPSLPRSLSQRWRSPGRSSSNSLLHVQFDRVSGVRGMRYDGPGRPGVARVPRVRPRKRMTSRTTSSTARGARSANSGRCLTGNVRHASRATTALFASVGGEQRRESRTAFGSVRDRQGRVDCRTSPMRPFCPSEDRPDVPVIDAGIEGVTVCSVRPSRSKSQPWSPRPRRVDHVPVLFEHDTVRARPGHGHPRECLRFQLLMAGHRGSLRQNVFADVESMCQEKADDEGSAEGGVSQNASRRSRKLKCRPPRTLGAPGHARPAGSRPLLRGAPRGGRRPVFGGGGTACWCRDGVASVGWLRGSVLQREAPFLIGPSAESSGSDAAMLSQRRTRFMWTSPRLIGGSSDLRDPPLEGK